MTKKTSPETQSETEVDSETKVEETTEAVETTDEAPEAEEATEVVEETQEPEQQETPVEPAKGNSWFPAVAGGAIAAALGFGVAQLVPLQDTQDLEAALTEQSQEIATLREQIDARIAPLASKSELTTLTESIDDKIAAATVDDENAVDVEALVTDFQTTLDALATRLSDLEKRPIQSNEASSGAAEAYERELTAMRETLEAQRTDIEAVAKDAQDQIAAAKAQAEELQAGAEAAANAAIARAALTRIDAAMASGGAFGQPLLDLSEALGSEPPADLLTASNTGVVTLAELRSSFPEAARAALAVSAADAPDESALERMGSFLRSQTNARSLTPREGNDPDAILSRAEAATGNGDLTTALQELSALPPEGQSAMQDWINAAEFRLKIKAALTAFETSATGN
ncbi:COG4223 family protein [Falsihalocynthiibacter sp. SS001]|uniref:COG4223 family protein n=1 Tax=Falsihalocynthiibacter sp. SS001 TaxID=3349698 RepID=UPI0036D36553